MSRNLMSVVLASVVGTLVIGTAATGAVAQESSGFYVGAGFGAVKLPSEDGFNFSNPKNGSIDFGYSFSENWAVEARVSQTVSEGALSANDTRDITSGLRSALMDEGFTSAQAVTAVKSASLDMTLKLDASVDSYGIYGVYRSSGQVYFKAKAGLVSVKTTLDGGASKASLNVVDSLNQSTNLSPSDMGFDLSDLNQSMSETETKFSAGIGGGYKFSEKLAAELEYTQLTSDFDTYTLSIKYSF
jgi:outer membrane immunogenic protein